MDRPVRRILVPFTKSGVPDAIVATRAALRAGADDVVAFAADGHDVDGRRFADGVRVLKPADVGIDDERLGVSAAAFGARHLPRVVVGDLVRGVADDGDHVVLLDPTVRLVGGLDPVWEALGDHETAVVPTLLEPGRFAASTLRIGLEGKVPTVPVELLGPELVGTVNASLLGFRVGPQNWVLDHWPLTSGVVDHREPLDHPQFQAWLDGIVTHPSVAAVRAPGMLLGFFNLAEHETAGADDDGVLVDGEPLRALDLRGYDPRRARVLAAGQAVGFLSEHPALIPEVLEQGRELLAAGWHVPDADSDADERLETEEGEWATLPSGRYWTEAMRHVYRFEVAEGRLAASPFTPAGEAAAFATFAAPGIRGAAIGINKLLWQIWLDRPDLQHAYPLLDGADGPGFVGWAWAHGRDENLIPETLLPAWAERIANGEPLVTSESHHVAPPVDTGQLAVNVAGYFSTEIGLGESARLLVGALDASDVHTVPIQGRVIPVARQNSGFEFGTPDQAVHPISLLVINGDTIPEFARDVGEEFFRDRYTIAFWWWEVDPYPAEHWNLSLPWVDEIWVGTEFVKGLIEPHVDVPVVQVRVPVADPPPVTVTRERFGIAEDETVFVYIWNYQSAGERKNPLGLVTAYLDAFGPDEGARLVLKCVGAEHRIEEHEEIKVAIAGRPDITLVDRYLDADEKDALVGLADCYVSPHRSEGFGYTLAEAMAYGKPVICTNYGGVTDFANSDTALLVDWVPRVVGPFAPPYPPDGVWADPDLVQLAGHMRWVKTHPEKAAALGAKAAEAIKRTHSREAAGQSMRRRLEQIATDRAAGSAPKHTASQPQQTTAAPQSSTARRRMFEQVSKVPGIGTGVSRARRTWWNLMDRAVAARTRPTFDHLAGRLDSVDGAMGELHDRHDDLERTFSSFRRQVSVMRGDLARTDDLATRQRDELRTAESRLAITEGRVSTVDAVLDQHLAEHRTLPLLADDRAFEHWTDDQLGAVEGFRTASGTSEAESYRTFEDAFRGSAERVRELQKPYVPLLEGQGPVLDCGCGRGELLGLLTEAGVEARGVDSDPGMLAIARKAGFDVVDGDAIAHLASLEDGSLGAVTAIEVIEHLPEATLRAFFGEAFRVLRPGGTLIVETVNPHAIHALKSFWLDLTHEHPLFPEVVLEYCRQAGFGEGAVFHPTGTGEVAVDRFREPAYAVIARRVSDEP